MEAISRKRGVDKGLIIFLLNCQRAKKMSKKELVMSSMKMRGKRRSFKKTCYWSFFGIASAKRMFKGK